MAMSIEDCTHGHQATLQVAVDGDGRTSCCGAFTSISTGDGVECCRCCYAEVTARVEQPTDRTTFDIETPF